MPYYQFPPKSAFPHTIIYKELILKDEWGKETYKETEIRNVWFNLSTKFSRAGNNSADRAPNASITILFRYSGKLPIFKNQSKISYSGDEYTIILSKELIINGMKIGWRLEVI